MTRLDLLKGFMMQPYVLPLSFFLGEWRVRWWLNCVDVMSIGQLLRRHGAVRPVLAAVLHHN